MKGLLRRIGIALGVLTAILLLAAAGGYFVSEQRVAERVAPQPEKNTHLDISSDSATLARGRHLARAITKCVDCHTDDLGGKVLVDNPAMGRWVPANITRGKGGMGSQLSADDIVRAVRHGIAPDGRKLILMPASQYIHLDSADLAAIVAYVRSMPPVDRELPEARLGFIARMLLAARKLPLYDADVIDHTQPYEHAPPAGPTAEYGHYLAEVGGCVGCHGPTLAGGKIPQGDPSWPPAANITPTGLGTRYDEAKFMRALREGARPEGTPINEAMPWRWTREMTDDEIRAVYAYLKTVPPREFGAR